MVLVPNNQSFAPGASGTIVTSSSTVFRTQMDSVLLGGRNITLHLPPNKTQCPAGCKFNSTYNKFIGVNSAICGACKGEGFILEPRQTIYRANIRWVDETLASPRSGGEDTPGGRVFESTVRTKTVVESYNHILNCMGADIDGVKCTLWGDPRQTGWNGQLYYVISFWKKSNKKTGNG